MTTTTTIEAAVQTVCSEIPEASVSDKLDAVYLIVGAVAFVEDEGLITERIEALS